MAFSHKRLGSQLPSASCKALEISDLIYGSQLLAEIKALSPVLLFRTRSSLANSSYLAFSDASQGSSSCGQTGYVSGLYLPAGGAEISQALEWISYKQKRGAFSSMGAEILAAPTSSERGRLMAESLQALHKATVKLPFMLKVDSHGLYSTVTTLHEGADYRLRLTVARMRGSFENGEISVMQRVSGTQHPADALTKRNVEMFKILNGIMQRGLLEDEVLQGSRRIKRESSTSK